MNGKPHFMGYEVVLSTQILAGTAATDLSALSSFAFGDFSKAGLLGVRRDVNVFASDQRYVEFDQLVYRGTSRFDAIWHGLGDSTNAGAVVALIRN